MVATGPQQRVERTPGETGTTDESAGHGVQKGGSGHRECGHGCRCDACRSSTSDIATASHSKLRGK